MDRASLLHLPQKLRDYIYRKVLTMQSPVYVFQDSPRHEIDIFAPERPAKWLSLLYVNKEIGREARGVLYANVQFHFIDNTGKQAELLQAFLNCIGKENSCNIRHMAINFPMAHVSQEHDFPVIVQNDDVRSLQLLQKSCSNLQILETVVQGYSSAALTGDNDDSQKMLAHIDGQLRAIPTLREIRIIFNSPPSAEEIQRLRSQLGWQIFPRPDRTRRE